MAVYIQPTPETAGLFFGNPPEGPIVMLNLLSFKEEADYTQFPDIAPAEPISGEEAYRIYTDSVDALIQASEAEVLFEGKGGSWVIGPEGAGWDHVLIVRWPSARAIMGVGQSPEYKAIEGHRTAALRDSRLLPMIQKR